MNAPEQIQPKGPGDYLEIMSKAVFQSGISWKVVNSKWADIREALRGFDPVAVANITPMDLDELTADKRVIRNRRKLEAIVENARRILTPKSWRSVTGASVAISAPTVGSIKRLPTCASSSSFSATVAHTTSCGS